jgi:hypothetical protein
MDGPPQGGEGCGQPLGAEGGVVADRAESFSQRSAVSRCCSCPHGVALLLFS